MPGQDWMWRQPHRRQLPHGDGDTGHCCLCPGLVRLFYRPLFHLTRPGIKHTAFVAVLFLLCSHSLITSSFYSRLLVLGRNTKGHTKLIGRWRGVHCMHPSAFLHLAVEAERLIRDAKDKEQQQQHADALPLLLEQIHLAREKHDRALLACCKRSLPLEEAAAGPAIAEYAPKYDDFLSRAWEEHPSIEVNALSRKQLVRMWWRAGSFDPGWWDKDAAILTDMIKWVASISELLSQLPPVPAPEPHKTPRAEQRSKMKATREEKSADTPKSLSAYERKLIEEYRKMEAKLRATAPLSHQFGKRLDKVPVYDRKSVAIGVTCVTGEGITPRKHRLKVKKIPVLPDDILRRPAGDFEVALGDSQPNEKQISQTFHDSGLVRGMCRDMMCYSKLVQELPHVTSECNGRHPLDGYKTFPQRAGISATLRAVSGHINSETT
ncbi:unnamed protein product [Chrysoparadoxa australica]